MTEFNINIPFFTFNSTPIFGEFVNEILTKVDSDTIHFAKLLNTTFSDNIILSGTKLYNYKSPLENMESLGSNSLPNAKIYNIENLNFVRRENEDYFANSDGLLVVHSNLVHFIPINYDGFCEVTISEDKYVATASFFHTYKNGKKLTEDDVIRAIREKKISIELNNLEIKNSIEYVNSNNLDLENIIVASGKQLINGEEAWMEYLFQTEHKIAPIIDEHGHTDFHSSNLLESVVKNQKIAIFHPKIDGIEGFDVFGEKIYPPKIAESKPPNGQNFYYSEAEPNHILSKIDGYITLVGGNIVITNLCNINGDVDYHTGHIISKGSVVVSGNVKSGFNLDLSENIKISGYVKDSNLKAGGSVTIAGGFSGTGEGKIIAGGDVTVRYIRNQIIYSRGNISVEKEVVEAKLYAKGDIRSQKNEMFIIGGHLIAGGNVIANNLGHEYGVKTLIEVGYDYDILNKIKRINESLESQKKELILLKSQLEANMASMNIRSQKLSKAILINYQMKKKNYDALLTTKVELKNSITNPSNSKVIVSGKIYPGVEIIINAHHIEITELLISKVFSVSPDVDEIIISNK